MTKEEGRKQTRDQLREKRADLALSVPGEGTKDTC
jgi:hypothetical protein